MYPWLLRVVLQFWAVCVSLGSKPSRLKCSWCALNRSTDCYQLCPSQLVGIHAIVVVWYFEYHLSLSDNSCLLNFERLSTIAQANQFLGRSDYSLHLKFKMSQMAAHQESTDGPVRRTGSRDRTQVRLAQHFTGFLQLCNHSKTHDKTCYNSRTFEFQHTTGNISGASQRLGFLKTCLIERCLGGSVS